MPVRHVKIAPGGRVVLPAEFRKALEVSVGDSVVIAGRRADPATGATKPRAKITIEARSQRLSLANCACFALARRLAAKALTGMAWTSASRSRYPIVLRRGPGFAKIWTDAVGS